ncbi:MAG: crossover junction endodeoxyribonuclease RuvC [Chitinophagaceae bacterium]
MAKKILQNAREIILGIDPGTLVMGYGLIAVEGNRTSLVEMGVLQLSKYKNHPERLSLIFQKMETLIRTHRPVAVAIEAPFFGKNIQSMLKLGRAQGVAIAAAMMHSLEATEYAPRKIKQSITGKGGATKEQVWGMLQRILDFEERPEFMDATDALAVALCHHYQRRQQLIQPRDTAVLPKKKTAGGAKNWASFLADNQDRIISKK